ncbi:MAG: hypothetical protein ACR2HR_14615 [Euzebya sp.]
MTVIMITITACTTGSDEEAEVPADFVSLDGGESFSLSYPGSWEILSNEDTEVRVAEPGSEDVRPSAAVTLDTTYSSGEGGFDTAVSGSMTVLNNVRQGVEELDAQDVVIAGASTARLIESTYTTGSEVPVHHFDLFALSGDGQLFYARSEAPSDVADPVQLRAIVTSLVIR